MHSRLLFGLFLLSASLFGRPYLTEPALSPDGREIAFVSGGDIWTVPANGGEARLLVSHPANESKPLYSPDGRKLAFISTRTGNGDIYVLDFATGALQQITFSDSMDQLDNWSRDGKYLYFTSTVHDIAGMNDIYRVKSDGGTPMPVSADRYANEYFAAPAPDGATLAMTARGIVSAQWWRNGHSHIDESEIYVRHEGSPAKYDRITDGKAKDLWPMWSPDAHTLYFVSDRSGVQNVWEHRNGSFKQLTKFTEGRVLWPTIGYDGKTILFEHDFAIWQVNTANGKTSQVPITLRGAAAGPATTHLTLSTGINGLALSPDSKKIAFTLRGQVFAAPGKEGGNAFRVTQTTHEESDPVWAPDNSRLVYLSDRDGAARLYYYDFRNNTEKPVAPGGGPQSNPVWSHDGKLLAYFSDGRQLHIFDPATGADRKIAEGEIGRPPVDIDAPIAWSPDDRWIAFMSRDRRYFSNVSVVPLDGGAARPVSFLANTFGGSVKWSGDGKYLLFVTSQRTETAKVARIDLLPRTPSFREDQFRDLFREESPRSPERPPATAPAATPADAATVMKDDPAKTKNKAVRIVFEGIRQRLTFLPVGVDARDIAISPDGKTLLLVASAAGQQSLYTYSLDDLATEPPVAKQLTSTPGPKSHPRWSADGKEVYFLDAGKIVDLPVDTRVPRPVNVTAELDVDFAQEKLEMFHQAWAALDQSFFDEKFHGVNWHGVYDSYLPLVKDARTPDEVRRLLNLMVGELNSSHSGVAAPLASNVPSSGHVGLAFDRAAYESNGRLLITEVSGLSPAAIAGIQTGQVLTAIDGHAIGAHENVDEFLQHKINRRTVLTIDGKDVVVRPVNTATEKNLLYRDWVEKNRAYVSKISDGRLGYVHMYDMSADSLDRLAVDLDAENSTRQGVVIDVRNNNGGFVNAYALDVLSRRGYLHMTYRGFERAAARSILGQRSLELPTVLVVNQHSLSDAEDFTEGYRAMKLGEVVGEPTAGWIIFTSAAQLVDGSTVRVPFAQDHIDRREGYGGRAASGGYLRAAAHWRERNR